MAILSKNRHFLGFFRNLWVSPRQAIFQGSTSKIDLFGLDSLGKMAIANEKPMKMVQKSLKKLDIHILKLFKQKLQKSLFDFCVIGIFLSSTLPKFWKDFTCNFFVKYMKVLHVISCVKKFWVLHVNSVLNLC